MMTNAERAATRNLGMCPRERAFSTQICPGNRGFYSYLPIMTLGNHVISVCNFLLV
jgi:hypothetical protein